MAKKSGKTPKQADRHKAGRIVRLPETLCLKLDVLARENHSSVTHEAVLLVKDGLSRKGLLPAPERNGSDRGKGQAP